ncbi:hypothetical protein BIV57_17915 [Mangrovactinospora gilvigrisea]|uniref:Uncharacterized protein n=1 Tax=Mangrovactinospora gilvigrisea TaxID=1428644 RepID=A0A1J7C902_9ACTN|nr:hypothetical protein [Mangrovactinospora gilvigrisea]OIV36114.1 hypothetical protein BIV57_17915 [Mangrovactinospora gilvigrisea]
MGQMKKAHAIGAYNDAGTRVNQWQYDVGSDTGHYNREVIRLKKSFRIREAEFVSELPDRIGRA